MKLIELRAFEGPSLHSDKPCVRITCDWPQAELPKAEFSARIAETLPADKGWGAALQRAKALVEDLDDVSPPAAVGALAAALQDERIGAPPAYRIDGERVAIDAPEFPVAEHAARMAVELGREIFAPDWTAHDVRRADRLRSLRRRFLAGREQVRLDFTTRVVLDAARARDIPVRIAPSSGNMLVLGRGKARRRMVVGMSDASSAVAMRVVARDKRLTNDVLRRGGVPVPRQFLVASQDDVRAAIEALGFPLVIKGRTVDKGHAVTTDVRSMDDVRRGIDKVKRFASDILFEQQVDGEDFRMTVVGGRLIAAARRATAHVVGDGVSTVEELIAKENSARATRGRYAHWLVPLRLDEDSLAVLAGQGLAADEVLDSGRVARLRGASNITQGATTDDVTDLVCDAARRAVERAAVLVGLDVAGVDVRAANIAAPLEETGGAVLEVNSFAALRAHYLTPTPPRDVAGAVIENLYPCADRARVPFVIVAGPYGRDVADRLATALGGAGLCIGLSFAGGLRVGEETLSLPKFSAHESADAVLVDPRVDIVVSVVTADDLVAHGLPWGDCTAAIIQVPDEPGDLDLAALNLLARCAREAVVVDGDADRFVGSIEPGRASVMRVSGVASAVSAVAPFLHPTQQGE